MDILAVLLSDKQFKRISELAYTYSGIKLGSGKEELVKSRLVKRLRALSLTNFDDYIDYVENDRTFQELPQMIYELTTNKTSFFRELPHFDYLRQSILPTLRNKRIRIWSAGCSSGEEPYTIAIVLREELPEIDRCDVAILATDLSKKVLSKAKSGIYDEMVIKDLPNNYLKYFDVEKTGSGKRYQVRDNIKKLIKIAQLNLMEEWPMKSTFNLIFCRNVMIYFDKETQNRLVNRFWEYLDSGGHLFVGHSESLTGLSHKFKFIQPATYMKE